MVWTLNFLKRSNKSLYPDEETRYKKVENYVSLQSPYKGGGGQCIFINILIKHCFEKLKSRPMCDFRYLFGLVSYGSARCGVGKPVVYTRFEDLITINGQD